MALLPPIQEYLQKIATDSGKRDPLVHAEKLGQVLEAFLSLQGQEEKIPFTYKKIIGAVPTLELNQPKVSHLCRELHTCGLIEKKEFRVRKER